MPNGRIPRRDQLFPGEDAYFKANPHVTGMAAEDNQVIINPYSTLNENEREAVATNEYARILMRNGTNRPAYQVTPQQRQSFAGTEYGKPENEQSLRETIAARILTGDKSAGQATPEQSQFVEQLRAIMNGRR